MSMDQIVAIIKQIAGTAAPQIMLIVVFMILLKATQGIGALDEFFNKGRAGASRGARGFLEEKAENLDNRRTIAGNQGGGGIPGYFKRRSSRRRAVKEGTTAEANRSRAEYISDLAKESPEFRKQLAGGSVATPEAIERALAGAINISAQLEADEVKAANAVIKNLNLSDAQLQQLAKGENATDARGNVVAAGSQAMQIAAIQKQAQSHVRNINELLDQAANGNLNEKARQTLAESLATSGSKPAYVNSQALESIRQGVSKDARSLAVDALNSGAYSSEKIAEADKDEIQFVGNTAATDPGVKTAARVTVRANARKVIDDPRLRAKVGKSLDEVLDLRDGKDPGPL